MAFAPKRILFHAAALVLAVAPAALHAQSVPQGSPAGVVNAAVPDLFGGGVVRAGYTAPARGPSGVVRTAAETPANSANPAPVSPLGTPVADLDFLLAPQPAAKPAPKPAAAVESGPKPAKAGPAPAAQPESTPAPAVRPAPAFSAADFGFGPAAPAEPAAKQDEAVKTADALAVDPFAVIPAAAPRPAPAPQPAADPFAANPLGRRRRTPRRPGRGG